MPNGVTRSLTPAAASRAAYQQTTAVSTNPTYTGHSKAYEAHKTAQGLQDSAGNGRKAKLHNGALEYHRVGMNMMKSDPRFAAATKGQLR